MAFSVIFHQGLIGSFNLFSRKLATRPGTRRISTASCGSSNLISGKRATRPETHRMSTAAGGLCSSSPPWMMLPQEFGPGNMSFKFYRLAEKEVITVSRKLDMVPKEDERLKGSSHGWLAYLNHRSQDLFLYNPISGGHVKLPPTHTLPNFDQESVEDACGDIVSRLIISSSPENDQHECRALITYNRDEVAFCCPGQRNDKWTLIGGRRGYVDCCYCSRRKVFFFLTSFGELETWDLSEPYSPRKIPLKKEARICFEIKGVCLSVDHVVVAENNDVLAVTQYVAVNMCPDGSIVDFEDSYGCPTKTVDFAIQRYDPVGGDFEYVDGSCLDGMAIFVGFCNHSSVVSTTDFPELKPNSIYFTDALENLDVLPYGGHDIGIFDFKDKTVSPCYYPCDILSMRKIVPEIISSSIFISK